MEKFLEFIEEDFNQKRFTSCLAWDPGKVYEVLWTVEQEWEAEEVPELKKYLKDVNNQVIELWDGTRAKIWEAYVEEGEKKVLHLTYEMLI